jgi:hypothetical protein
LENDVEDFAKAIVSDVSFHDSRNASVEELAMAEKLLTGANVGW